jgi:ABC-type Zn uptake system ZnuABC Zn-binding protein ZnuA
VCLLASGSSGAADRPKVVATTVQITALTTAVAGDFVALKGIIPAGVDPHEFEPTASDLVAIEGATLVLRHGIGLDDWLDRTLKAGKRATVVTVTRGVRLQKGEEDGKVVDDPHVWHDPANAKKMVDDITAALAGSIRPPDDLRHGPAYAAARRARVSAAIINEIPPGPKLVTTTMPSGTLRGFWPRSWAP